VQVSWDDSISKYTAEKLRGIFAKHGGVQDVIPRPVKKKSKGSALVVMADLQVRHRHTSLLLILSTSTSNERQIGVRISRQTWLLGAGD
jgi:hypothetical protein